MAAATSGPRGRLKLSGFIVPYRGDGRADPHSEGVNYFDLYWASPSAYFVPGDWLTEMLSGWAEQGLRVRVLANAQEAKDVLVVHGGYLKYRDDLLDSGVKQVELKSSQDRGEDTDLLSQFGSSKISLHAKAFVIDYRGLSVGSFNFDPRSAHLNTEMGFLIKGSKLPQTIFPDFAGHLKTMPTMSAAVRMGV